MKKNQQHQTNKQNNKSFKLLKFLTLSESYKVLVYSTPRLYTNAYEIYNNLRCLFNAIINPPLSYIKTMKCC